jgi:rubredoxin
MNTTKNAKSTLKSTAKWKCPECKKKTRTIKAGFTLTRSGGRRQRVKCMVCGRVYYAEKSKRKGGR